MQQWLEEEAADESNDPLLLRQEARDCREAERGHTAVERVGGGGAQTRDETDGAPIRQGTADAEHTNGANRRGYREAEHDALEKQQRIHTSSSFRTKQNAHQTCKPRSSGRFNAENKRG